MRTGAIGGAVLLLLLLLWGCKQKFDQPLRPAGVPKDSLWVGGSDGGVFFQIRGVAHNDSLYQMTIYHDRTGEVLFKGLAELRPANRGRLKVDDPGSYSGWDGEKMILSEERTLQPVESRH